MRARGLAMLVALSLLAPVGMDLAVPAAASTEVSITPRAVRVPAKPTVKITGGTELTIAIKTPGTKRAYSFVLNRKSGKKWKKVRSYKTSAKTGKKVLDVRSGQYQVKVKATKRNKAVTKNFTYTEVVPMQPGPGTPTKTGYYAVDYDWVYYFPAGYTPTGRTYPAIVAFSPGQVDSTPGPYDAHLKNIADRYGFIVLTSRLYRNPASGPEIGPPARYDVQDQLAFNWYHYPTAGGYETFCTPEQMPDERIGGMYALQRQHIQNAFNSLPINRDRVVLTGISGGGSFSHAMSLWYPDLAAALVINTGMIWGRAIDPTSPDFPNWEQNGPTWNAFIGECRTAGTYAGRSRQAWFLESTTDFRYEEMLADAGQYRTLGWDVHEVLFSGGHTMAPVSVYDNVFNHLTQSLGWR